MAGGAERGIGGADRGSHRRSRSRQSPADQIEAVTGEQIEGIGAALWRRREVIFSGGCGYDLFGSFDVGMICLVSG